MLYLNDEMSESFFFFLIEEFVKAYNFQNFQHDATQFLAVRSST